MTTDELKIDAPLRVLADATELTLAQIADELGISLDYAKSLSSGREPISHRLLVKIAMQFGVDLRELAQGRAVLRATGEELTPELWQQQRGRLIEFENDLAAKIAQDPDYRTTLHKELSGVLIMADDCGRLFETWCELSSAIRRIKESLR